MAKLLTAKAAAGIRQACVRMAALPNAADLMRARIGRLEGNIARLEAKGQGQPLTRPQRVTIAQNRHELQVLTALQTALTTAEG